MKRCPECRKDYVDDSLLYCLDDGTPLVQGVVDEPQTAIFHVTDAAADVSKKANEDLGSLGYAYAIFGKREEAMAVLRELEARHSKRECPAIYPAAVYGALGDKDQAFAWLEKDFQARTGLLPYIALLPTYDTLRDDPRYMDLLRRTGFR